MISPTFVNGLEVGPELSIVAKCSIACRALGDFQRHVDHSYVPLHVPRVSECHVAQRTLIVPSLLMHRFDVLSEVMRQPKSRLTLITFVIPPSLMLCKHMPFEGTAISAGVVAKVAGELSPLLMDIPDVPP